MIKSLHDWFIYLAMLGYWAVTSILVSLIGTVLHLILPQKYAMTIGRVLLQKDFQFFIFVTKVSGFLILENEELKALANRQGAMIVAPNHSALWDVVFIVAQVPELICIMKESILRKIIYFQ